MRPTVPTPLPLDLPTPPPAPPSAAVPPPAAASALTLPAQLLPGLSTNLMVQALTREATDAANLICHAGVGVVFTIAHKRSRRSHFNLASSAVSTVRAANPAADVLIDRNRYSGNARAFADSPMDAQWIRDQLELMRLPWALGDPGFCRHLTDVRNVLVDAQRFGLRVVVPLAMPHQVMRDEADAVVDLVNDQDKPVAVILEHESDPFSAPGVARGLVRLLDRARVPVLLLRSDTSAVGAISHGAAVGAVGAHSGLRHVYPKKAASGGHPERLALVIPELLTFVQGDKFGKAYLADPPLSLWRCGCWFCHGRDLIWIPNNRESTVAAFQHSVAAIADLGARLQRQAAGTSPQTAWDVMCTTAQVAHDLVTTPTGTSWAPQDFLRHWHDLATRATVS